MISRLKTVLLSILSSIIILVLVFCIAMISIRNIYMVKPVNRHTTYIDEEVLLSQPVEGVSGCVYCEGTTLHVVSFDFDDGECFFYLEYRSNDYIEEAIVDRVIKPVSMDMLVCSDDIREYLTEETQKYYEESVENENLYNTNKNKAIRKTWVLILVMTPVLMCAFLLLYSRLSYRSIVIINLLLLTVGLILLMGLYYYLSKIH